MKLSTWAKQQGIAYITAWRWCKTGKMPCPWTRTPSGTILVQTDDQELDVLPTYVYCRVSSHTKKDDLARQCARCTAFCEASGWTVDRVVKEIASGMNDKRRKLTDLLNLPSGRLVIEHKDRLTRFGFNYLNILLSKLGWKVVVINWDENEQEDLIKDLVSIITSFCCRLYGLRRGHRKATEIKACVELVK